MASVVTSKSIQIAGGGIAGLTAAIQLKKYGFDPTMLDKYDRQEYKEGDEYIYWSN